MTAGNTDRRQKQSSLPGIAYNRHHGGHRPASAPIDNPAPSPFLDYMSSPPDGYEPHPGEAIFFEPDYAPYQADLPHLATDELHFPAPAFQPAPGQVEYDDLLMTPEAFERAMGDVPYPPDAVDPVPFDNDVMAEDILMGEDVPGAPDRILIEDGVVPDEFMGESIAGVEELDADVEMLVGPDVETEPDYDAPENLDGSAMDLLDYDAGAMAPGSLEQIVDQRVPEGPFPDPMQPDPLMQEQMYDEQMMDPYGMMPCPGPMGLPTGSMDPYGPMPPGLGPMGPGM